MNVIIPATFDLFHEGHKKLIDYAYAISDDVIIVVNSDSLCELNGKTPSDNETTRLESVKNYIKNKDLNIRIYIGDLPDDSLRFALGYAPCIWLTGRDWDRKKTSERNNVPETFWENNDIYLMYKDRVPNISSTQLKEKRK